MAPLMPEFLRSSPLLPSAVVIGSCEHVDGSAIKAAAARNQREKSRSFRQKLRYVNDVQVLGSDVRLLASDTPKMYATIGHSTRLPRGITNSKLAKASS